MRQFVHKKDTLLHRPPVRCDPHTVQIQPRTLDFIPSGLQLEELAIGKHEVIVLIDPAIPQIDVLPVAVDDEVLTRSRLLDGDAKLSHTTIWFWNLNTSHRRRSVLSSIDSVGQLLLMFL